MRSPNQDGIACCLALLLTTIFAASCTNTEASGDAIKQDWSVSAHADDEARAFTRWDEDEPPQIPENCAKCHSTPGYLDFLGADGSASGTVDKPAPTGTTVECAACHNEVSSVKDSALMPSQVKLTGLGRNSDCMECHQGRASAVQVSQLLIGIPPDRIVDDLSGPGIHNSPAGPVLYGSQAKGGFEYSGLQYSERYDHVVGFNNCTSCHDSHSLAVDPQRCSACHLGLRTEDDFRNTRISSSDYDGDRDTTEGMYGEIETLQAKLLQAIDFYIASIDGLEPLVINRRFVNEEGDSYTTWTPRLLRAAFNYQFSTLSDGGYVHHPKYTIQLLYDSIEDIGGSLSGMTRPAHD